MTKTGALVGPGHVGFQIPLGELEGLAGPRPVQRDAEQLRYEQHETRQLFGADRAAARPERNAALNLSDWTTQLRLLPNGQVGLMASLPQEVTHVEVTTAAP